MLGEQVVTPFEVATAITRTGAGEYTAELSADWVSLVGIHGGYTASIAARAVAATIDDTAMALRSVSTQFVSAPRPGPTTVQVAVEKAGRTTTFATARVVQDGRLRLLVSAVAGTDRGGASYDDRHPPRPPAPPPGLGRIAPPPEVIPADRVGHFANSELILDPATVPFSGGEEARLAGWLRPLGDEPATTEWLVCACDFFPPAVFARLTEPVPAATIDYSVHLLVPDLAARIGPGDYVFAEMRSAHSANGWAVEDGIVWAPDGTTIATSRQLRLAGG